MKQKSLAILVTLVVVAVVLGIVGYYGIGKNTLTTVTSVGQGITENGGVYVDYKLPNENPNDSDLSFGVDEIKKKISGTQGLEKVDVTTTSTGAIRADISDIVNVSAYGDNLLNYINSALGESNTLAFEKGEGAVDGTGTLTMTFKSGKAGITPAELDTAAKTISSFFNQSGSANIIVTREGNDSIKLVSLNAINAESMVDAYKIKELTIGKTNILGIKNIKQGLDLSGGVYIVYEAQKDSVTAEEMASAVSMIQERLDSNGWSEAEVAQEGEKRIRVEIPGVDDAETAIDEIGQTAKLYFKDENGNVLVDGVHVKDAKKATNQDSTGKTEVVVSLEFDDEGKKAFADATANNVGKTISIVLDDKTISAPTVNTAITDGKAVIQGSFDADSAEKLAKLIKAGSLPFELKVLEMNSVGARLGDNSLNTSIIGGLIGIALVLLFMLIYYRVSGLAADWALIIYICLDLIVLSLLKVTLTLPGIAGIILSIGMAVDANVIIFERIKEELNIGRSAKLAIHNGFAKAFSAILDGNVTTLIAGVVLYYFGTGPIKGFAQTLMIGIILSMFTALVITRWILNSLVGSGIIKPSLYGGKPPVVTEVKKEGEK